MRRAALVLAAACLASACGSSASPLTSAPPPSPTGSAAGEPGYSQTCAPVGEDQSQLCLSLIVGALDAQHAAEHLPPFRIPAGIGGFGVPKQFLLVVDEDRTARGLAPFAGLDAELSAEARSAAAVGKIPAVPKAPYQDGASDGFAYGINGLDIAYQLIYADGPGHGIPGCTTPRSVGCWPDRALLFRSFPTGEIPVMGAGDAPQGAIQPALLAQPSFAFSIAGVSGLLPLAASWRSLDPSPSARLLAPMRTAPSTRSSTNIADPPRDVAPVPDYAASCAPEGADESSGCRTALLAAINHAHELEGVPPLTLPPNYDGLAPPQQLMVVTDLERTSRGLPPFMNETGALDALALEGARSSSDPPSPSSAVLSDTLWAGGAANALEADYEWMYDDGYGSGNVECRAPEDAGCWAHRKGILDNFGTEDGLLLLGAAYDPTAYKGGPSYALCLIVSTDPRDAQDADFSWATERAFLAQGRSGG